MATRQATRSFYGITWSARKEDSGKFLSTHLGFSRQARSAELNFLQLLRNLGTSKKETHQLVPFVSFPLRPTKIAAPAVE